MEEMKELMRDLKTMLGGIMLLVLGSTAILPGLEFGFIPLLLLGLVLPVCTKQSTAG